MDTVTPDIKHKVLVVEVLILFEGGLHLEPHSSWWIFMLLINIFLLLIEKKWSNLGYLLKEETKDFFLGVIGRFSKLEVSLNEDKDIPCKMV